jgi:hypothetical protein
MITSCFSTGIFFLKVDLNANIEDIFFPDIIRFDVMPIVFGSSYQNKRWLV